MESLIAQSAGPTRRIGLTFAGQSLTLALSDNPAADALWRLVPFTGEFQDYSTNEKIIYLPSPLSEAGAGRFGNEQIGDVCYYAPWGNLAFYYAAYRYSPGLIRVGRLEGSIAPLRSRGTFPVSLARQE